MDQGEENACAVLLPFCYHRWQAYLPLFIDGMLSAPYSPAVLSSFVSGGILFANSLFLASGTQSDFSQADTAEYPLYIPPSGIDKSARFQ